VITAFISLLVCSVAACVIVITIWERRAQLVSLRGIGLRGDIELLHDVPRVRVRELTMTDPDTARLAMVAAHGHDDSYTDDRALVGLEFSIAMNESDPGFPLLREWESRECVLGIVIPPDSQLIRLRCLEDLQPLTLRRVDP
jgi:hypothetical protein